MENEYGQGPESVYSNKVRAGKRRTYFFDVRQTKGEDFYITLTESTKKFNGSGYTRHKIFLYKEDFNRFMTGLQGAVDHVKTELMPEYDYEQFDRRQEEWEQQQKLEQLEAENNPTEEVAVDESSTEDTPPETETTIESEEDISW